MGKYWDAIKKGFNEGREIAKGNQYPARVVMVIKPNGNGYIGIIYTGLISIDNVQYLEDIPEDFSSGDIIKNIKKRCRENRETAMIYLKNKNDSQLQVKYEPDKAEP